MTAREMREKVLNALDNCVNMVCEVCPYNKAGCTSALMKDAIECLSESAQLKCEGCSYFISDYCKQFRTSVEKDDYCSLGAWSAGVLGNGK